MVKCFRPIKMLSGHDEHLVMKLIVIVDKNTDAILGTHMMGINTPETILGMVLWSKRGYKSGF